MNTYRKWALAMKVRAYVTISGKVQGVFFRSYTKQKAKEQGVKGWVRNLQDGRVKAVLEGEEDAVKRVIEFCRKGPTQARVVQVKVGWEKYQEEFQDFKIRYR